MPINTELLSLALRLRAQQQQQAAAQQNAARSKAEGAFKTGLQFSERGVRIEDVLPVLRQQGLDPAQEQALLGIDKAMRRQRQQTKASEASTKLAGEAGTLLAGSAGVGGIQQEPTQQIQAVAGPLFREALLAASESSDPEAARQSAERSLLSARAQTIAREQEAAAKKERELAAEDVNRSRNRFASRVDKIPDAQKQFTRASQPFIESERRIRKIGSTARKAIGGNRQAQVALLFDFIQSRDATAVKDGERILVRNATALGERVANLVEQANSGRVLGPLTMKEIVDTMAGEFEALLEEQQDRQAFFRESLRVQGFSERQINAAIRDFTGRSTALLERIEPFRVLQEEANPQATDDPASDLLGRHGFQ